MEMHKIEVYTRQQELAHLLGSLSANTQLVGTLDVRYRQRRQQEESEAVTADTRVEIFTDTDPAAIMAHLSTVESVVDIQTSPCKPLFPENSAADQAVAAPAPAKPAPEKGPSVPASCRLSMISENTMRMNVDASMSPAFLWKIFHVLAEMELSVTNGRKYRQGEKDFITLTITNPAIDNNQTLQDAIKNILENEGLPASTLSNSTDSGCEHIAIRLDAGSNLPAIIIRATGNSAAIRNSLQEVFGAKRLDTIIARFTSRDNGIEDIYYLKQLGDTAVSDELARAIEQTILGKR